MFRNLIREGVNQRGCDLSAMLLLFLLCDDLNFKIREFCALPQLELSSSVKNI